MDGSTVGWKDACDGFRASASHGSDAIVESRFEDLKPPLDPGRAPYEAERCLYCGGNGAPAPCTAACPASVDVPAFIRSIAKGQLARAAEIILRDNPLGGSCGRVCPTEELCEGACVLVSQSRRPVHIGRLQRYATDAGFFSEAIEASSVAVLRTSGLKVAVIGAGPAGMACASQLATWGYKVTVYDSRPEPGGLIRFAIAPYRLVQSPLTEEMQRIQRLGVKFHFNHPILGPDAVRSLEGAADAVFLGVGLGEDLVVHYPGDDLPGVWESLTFIERLKTGRSPAVGHRVAVIGGGNTAIDVARESLRLGAEEVTIVYRRTKEEMPAYHQEVTDAEREGVRFLWLAAPVRFIGETRLESIQCQHMRLGNEDESGRRKPEPVLGSEFMLPVDTVIRAMGQRHRTEWHDWISDLNLTHGLIEVNPQTLQTSNAKYFAGGDAVNGGATVVDAVAMGKAAARGIRAYLQPNKVEIPQFNSYVASESNELADQMVYHQGKATLSVDRDWCKGCNICVEDCPAHILALDYNEKVYVTDMTRCILCGICAVRCPDFVISVATGDEEIRKFSPVTMNSGGSQYAASPRE